MYVWTDSYLLVRTHEIIQTEIVSTFVVYHTVHGYLIQKVVSCQDRSPTDQKENKIVFISSGEP